MENTEIAIVVNARLNSTRVHRKMVRPFGGSSLLDICLDKVSQINIPRDRKFLCAFDSEIIDVYNKYSSKISFIERSPESVAPKNSVKRQFKTFEHYKQIDCKYIMSINASCPFVSTFSIENAIECFVKNESHTLTTIKRHTNIFLNKEFVPINTVDFAVASEGNDEIYELSHAFHIFNRTFFIANGYFWDYSDKNPSYFLMEGIETLDIDNELDFSMCDLLYRSSKN